MERFDPNDTASLSTDRHRQTLPSYNITNNQEASTITQHPIGRITRFRLQEQSTKMEGPYWKDLIPMTLHRYPQIDIGKHFPVTTSQTIRKLPQSHNIRLGESLVFLQEQSTKMEGPYWKDLIPMTLHRYPQIDIGKHFPVTTSQTIRKLPQHTTSDWENHSFSFRNN